MDKFKFDFLKRNFHKSGYYRNTLFNPFIKHTPLKRTTKTIKDLLKEITKRTRLRNIFVKDKIESSYRLLNILTQNYTKLFECV